MANLQAVGDLQIDQDLPFQQRAWRFQRIGWWSMALILLAAALGLFGSGPISSAAIVDSRGLLRLDYERFLRFNATTSLTLRVQPDISNPAQLRIWLSRDYAEAFQIQQITPLPVQTQLAPEQLVLIFDLADASQPVEIALQLYIVRMGSLSGEIGLVDGPMVRFWQFVYP